MRIQCRTLASIVSLVAGLFSGSFAEFASAQSVVLEFYDDETNEPVSARFKWEPKSRKFTKPRTLLSAGSWWLADPEFSLPARVGEYEFLVQRGPEFTDVRGGFALDYKTSDLVEVEIPRKTYVRTERWYSADHSVQLPQDQAERWQRADAVDLISLPNEQATPILAADGAGEASAGEADKAVAAGKADAAGKARKPRASNSKAKSKNDEEATAENVKLVETRNKSVVGEQIQAFHTTHNEKYGRFRIHRLSPVERDAAPETFSDAMQAISDFETSSGGWIELIEPWARDVPILLSTGKVHGVQVLSSLAKPDSDESLAVRPPQDRVAYPYAKIQRTLLTGKSSHFVFAPFQAEDRIRFKGPQGAVKLGELCYWTMLEAGLRLTSTAGTDFGQTETYLGYNRNYFYSPIPPTPEVWAEAVRNGEVVITNGPLLRPMLNIHPPGATFSGSSDGGVDLHFDVSLTVREEVDYLDVIFNGETLYSERLENHYKKGEFPPLKINQSGWLVTRVVTRHATGYRLASSSPFYFHLDATPRISKRAVEFMIAWLDNSEADIRAKNEWDDYRPWVEQAKIYWRERLEQANAP